MGPIADRDSKLETKKSAKAAVPSILKMMETDAELKDFFKLIKETECRDKAVTLLQERLDANKSVN